MILKFWLDGGYQCKDLGLCLPGSRYTMNLKTRLITVMFPSRLEHKFLEGRLFSSLGS